MFCEYYYSKYVKYYSYFNFKICLGKANQSKQITYIINIPKNKFAKNLLFSMWEGVTFLQKNRFSGRTDVKKNLEKGQKNLKCGSWGKRTCLLSYISNYYEKITLY